jgi:DNA-binding MarR family transcriptional regulator
LDERVEISVQKLATLSYIAERSGCSMSEIADLLDLNKSAVSSMCVRLERGGLLRREPNPHDGRGALLFPTQKSARVRERSKSVFRALTHELTDGFSENEIEIVLRFLNAIVERFQGDEP